MIPVKGYAAQTPTSDLAPWDFQRRDVGPHDVQFDVQFCGVCHSDLHQIKNDWFPGIFPMVPGHEIVGKVIKVGSAVKKFKVGDLAGTAQHEVVGQTPNLLVASAGGRDRGGPFLLGARPCDAIVAEPAQVHSG